MTTPTQKSPLGSYRRPVQALEVEQIRELLSYDPESGLLTWRKNQRGSVKAGDVVGSPHKDSGRLDTRLRGNRYPVYRLAWLIMTGSWPVGVIDHINGDPSDNRWVNLRDVSQQDNVENILCARSDNQVGFRGVIPWKNTGKFVAIISLQGKKHWLGTYEHPLLAYITYFAVKSWLGQLPLAHLQPMEA